MATALTQEAKPPLLMLTVTLNYFPLPLLWPTESTGETSHFNLGHLSQKKHIFQLQFKKEKLNQKHEEAKSHLTPTAGKHDSQPKKRQNPKCMELR